jgi:hypothetical protein
VVDVNCQEKEGVTGMGEIEIFAVSALLIYKTSFDIFWSGGL